MESEYREESPSQNTQTKKYSNDQSNKNQKKKPLLSTKIISLSGIFLVFVLLFLFLAGSSTNIQMVSYCLSSLFVIIILEEGTLVAGITFYAASSLLALLLLPNKLAIIPYVLFFGHYGIWYHWFDKSQHSLLIHALNYLIANISIFTIYFTCKDLFTSLKIPSFLLFIPVVEIFIVLYDYMYGKCLHYYRRDVKSKLS